MRKLLITIVLMLAGSFGAFAQGRRGGPGPGPGGGPGQMPAVLERLERMSAEERKAFLDGLPPMRRARIEQRLREWEQLTPAQRARLGRQFRRFRELPPARQQQARECFLRLSNTPMPRRQMLGRQIMLLRAMNPEEREAWLNAPYFQNRFDQNERDIIKGLMDIGPEPPPELDPDAGQAPAK